MGTCSPLGPLWPLVWSDSTGLGAAELTGPRGLGAPPVPTAANLRLYHGHLSAAWGTPETPGSSVGDTCLHVGTLPWGHLLGLLPFPSLWASLRVSDVSLPRLLAVSSHRFITSKPLPAGQNDFPFAFLSPGNFTSMNPEFFLFMPYRKTLQSKPEVLFILHYTSYLEGSFGI